MFTLCKKKTYFSFQEQLLEMLEKRKNNNIYISLEIPHTETLNLSMRADSSTNTKKICKQKLEQ